MPAQTRVLETAGTVLSGASPPAPSVLRLGNDRVIATARIVVAVLSTAALWLDPAGPAAGRASLAYALFVAYLCAAIAVLVVNLRDQLQITERARLLLHLIDIVFIALVVYFTAGATRAFFGLFVFVMLAAHMRWHWRGMVWTALAVLAAYAAIKVPLEVAALGHTGIDDFIVRLIYIGVVAGLLVYVGRAQEEANRRMILAAAWPTSIATAPDRGLPAYLEHASRVLGSTELCLVWFPECETAAETVHFDRWRGTSINNCDRDLLEDWFGPGGETRIFALDTRTGTATIISEGMRRTVDKPPLPPGLLRAAGAPMVMVIPFVARNGYGCLLARLHMLGTDEIVLGEIVASRMRAWADEMELIEQLREAQTRRQRLELAGELHDGVLQTLAGTSLQLQGLRRLVAEGVPQAAERIDELTRGLASEQSDLRRRLRELAPAPAGAEEGVDLSRRLRELAQLIERRWHLAAECRLQPSDAIVAPYVDHQLSHLVIEAAANAAKHSRARLLDIRVTVQPSDVLISIRNDRAVPPEAAARAFEPAMLRARLTHLGGTLQVRPARDHVVVDMAFPAREALVA